VDGPDVLHLEIAGYVLGKIEPAETAAFEAHLAGCAPCQQHLQDLERLPDLLATAVPERPVPAGLRARVFLAVRTAAEAEAHLSVDHGPSAPGIGLGASSTPTP
jgi:anti-sigma factor RsiW